MSKNSAITKNLMPRLEEIHEVVMEILKNREISLDKFKIIDQLLKDNIPKDISPELKAIYYIGFMKGCKTTILESSKDLRMIRDAQALKNGYKIDTSLN